MGYAHIFCGWSKRPKPNESRREMIPMHDQTIWQRISTAPFGCDPELAVIEEAHVRQSGFRLPSRPGWLDQRANGLFKSSKPA